MVTERAVAVTPCAVRGADGAEHEVDTIILGTGFHVTDNPVAARVRGSDGRSLAEHWADTGAYAYLGTTVPGFPNLFLLAGPNTGIGHTSVVVMIEAQLTYVLDAIGQAVAANTALELRDDVYQRWIDEIRAKAMPTVWNSGGCASWYLDDAGRNTVIWPGQTYRFRQRTKRFDAESYTATPR